MSSEEVTYAPVTYADLPGWADDDHAAALRAFLVSCEKVLAGVRAGNATGKVPTPPELLSACFDAGRSLGGRPTKAAARAFFEAHFAPHRVVHSGPEGLLTGYYEPLLEGSRTKAPGFEAPIYRRPPELVNLVSESMRGASGANLTHARKTKDGLEPFDTREVIDRGSLAGRGLELIYLRDSVDVFFMQVQGSGRIRLTDGSTIRVSYDGKNGHPYASIGRYLIENGHLGAHAASMKNVARWLRADPKRGRRVMWHNTSYVFFRELKGKQAASALGVLTIPLMPRRSLAVDAGVHALGLPVYVTSSKLTHAGYSRGFHQLMVAHDVGSAIRGPERGDIYFGSGAKAESAASVTKHPGRFFVLLPRPLPATSAEGHAPESGGGGAPWGGFRQASQ